MSMTWDEYVNLPFELLQPVSWDDYQVLAFPWSPYDPSTVFLGKTGDPANQVSLTTTDNFGAFVVFPEIPGDITTWMITGQFLSGVINVYRIPASSLPTGGIVNLTQEQLDTLWALKENPRDSFNPSMILNDHVIDSSYGTVGSDRWPGLYAGERLVVQIAHPSYTHGTILASRYHSRSLPSGTLTVESSPTGAQCDIASI